MSSPSLTRRLDPRAFSLQRIDSAWWHWVVNTVAGSPALDRRTRLRLLRLGGIDVQNAIVEGGCFFFSSDMTIGDHSMINHGCHFDTRAHIELGEAVGIASEVMLCTSTHDLGPSSKRWGAYRTAPITVGPGTWLGIRTIILPGVTIGEGVMVAAGAVVIGDLESNGVYAGIPAKRIRDL
ncbi:MAG TPA: acyltransferase [Thermoleophilaceae bacterium]